MIREFWNNYILYFDKGFIEHNQISNVTKINIIFTTQITDNPDFEKKKEAQITKEKRIQLNIIP